MNTENEINLKRSVKLSQWGKERDMERFCILEKKSREFFSACKKIGLEDHEFIETEVEGLIIRLTNTATVGSHIRGPLSCYSKAEYTLQIIDESNKDKNNDSEFVIISRDNRFEVPLVEQSYKDKLNSFKIAEKALEILENNKKDEPFLKDFVVF